MNKIIIFSVYVIVNLLQSQSIGAGTNGVSEKLDGTDKDETETIGSKNAIARLVDVKLGHDDNRIAAVQDNSTSSGWAVQITNRVSVYRARTTYAVYVYAMTKEQPHFRKYIIGNNLCNLVTNQSYASVTPTSYFYLPRQIMHMIFTMFNNTDNCEVQNVTSPILSKSYIEVNESQLILAYKNSFQLVFNIETRADRYHEDTQYIFQAIFNVQLLDTKKESSGGNEGNSEKSGNSKYYCSNTQWNYWTLWQFCRVFEFAKSILGMGKLKQMSKSE